MLCWASSHKLVRGNVLADLRTKKRYKLATQGQEQAKHSINVLEQKSQGNF